MGRKFLTGLLLILLAVPLMAAGPIPVDRRRSTVPITMNNAEPEPAVETPAPAVLPPAPVPRPVPAMPAAGKPPLAFVPAPETVEPVPPSAPATDAQAAYERAIDEMLQVPENADRQFRLGQAAFLADKYPQAVMAFERVLMLDPAADRARLEMARCYLAMGQPARAKEELQMVLMHNPPPAVRANIETMLARITAAPTAWKISGAASLAWFYDDNINTGLSSNLVVLNNQPFQMSDTNLRRADNGVMLQGAVNVTHPVPDKPGWLFTAGTAVYQKWHGDNYNDLLYLRGQAGLQFIQPAWLAQGLAKYEYVEFDNRSLVSMEGFEPSVMWAVRPDLQSMTAGVVEHRDHHRSIDRSGNYYALGETLRWMFDPREYVFTAGVRVFREHAGTRANSNNGWDISAGLSFKLPERFRLDGRAARRVTRFYDRSTNFAGDLQRRDHQYDYAVILNKEFPQLPGFSLEYSYRVTHNNSNTDLHDYRKNIQVMAVNFVF